MRSKSLFLLAVLLTATTLVSTAFAQTQKSGSGGAVAEVTRLEQEDLSLHHRLHIELSSDLRETLVGVFVLHGRGTRDHAERANLRQIG
jgi:hypothetical protein